jgi:hypothetical protein
MGITWHTSEQAQSEYTDKSEHCYETDKEARYVSILQSDNCNDEITDNMISSTGKFQVVLFNTKH